jgi:uncharacterized repeat protein (TIGR03803 family)
MSAVRGASFFLSFLLIAVLSAWAGSQQHVLYSFKGSPDGMYPIGSLISDKSGNLYGTASEGGESTGCYGHGCGTVFELQPGKSGWKLTILHTFTGTLKGGGDGALPFGGLVMDNSGNLYGTTVSGGQNGSGTAFELSPTAKGWKETILYRFGDGADGGYPQTALIFDTAGNLYGVAQAGGSNSSGVIFELSPASGHWTESVLYGFADGTLPGGAPLRFHGGNLYGTTPSGGDSTYPCQWASCGTVFELAHGKTGWTYQLLYAFTGGNDGAVPFAGVTFDKQGNLYGATAYGTGTEDGVVFELSPSSGGWSESVLHGFTLGDGAYPLGNLTFDGSGNLWGTASAGGSGGCVYPGCGVVFELKPSGEDWEYVAAHDFNGSAGSDPQGGLLYTSGGSFYGTTFAGGASDAGTVYEILP